MSLYTYQIFETVAEQENFARAAETLHLTPSAVSHAIAKLEEEFGFPLFIRNRSGVSLTANGSYLLPYVGEQLQADERLRQEVDQINGLTKGKLVVGAFESVTVHWLPSIIRDFHSRYPGISVELLQGSVETLQTWIRSRKLNLALLSHMEDEPLPCPAVPLYRDRIVCATPIDYVPPNRTFMTLEDIRAFPILRPSYQTDLEINWFMSKSALTPSPDFQISSDNTLFALISQGLGVSLFSELMTRDCPHKIRAYPVCPPAFRQISLYQDEALSPADRKMLDFIRSFLSKEPWRKNSLLTPEPSA